jgi:2-methylcitrate dehydratase PrpD
MTLVADHHIDAASIDSIRIGMPENAMRVVDNREMHNICVQDMVCATGARGGLGLREQPFPAILSDPTFVRLRARVTVGVDPDLNRGQPNGRGAQVTITTADGSTVSRRIDHPRGHSRRGGVTWSDLSAKWHEGLPECDIERVVALAQRLDELDDVNVLADALMPANTTSA